MDPLQFVAASHVVIVAGKGSVGKTTVTAAAAVALARSGRRVLAVEVDGTGALRRLLAVPDGSLVPLPSPLLEDGSIRVAAIDPEPSLVGYLSERGFGALGTTLSKSGMLNLIATAIPGIRDLVVLGRLRQLTTADEADVVLVDAPAAGHALSFLRTPTDIVHTARSGPIRQQADASRAFITDSSQVTVTLVTTPQATPVRELIETAYSIEDELDLTLGPVVVNMVEPQYSSPATPSDADHAAREFLAARIRAEKGHISELADQLALPRIELPRLDGNPSNIDHLQMLADRFSS